MKYTCVQCGVSFTAATPTEGDIKMLDHLEYSSCVREGEEFHIEEE